MKFSLNIMLVLKKEGYLVRKKSLFDRKSKLFPIISIHLWAQICLLLCMFDVEVLGHAQSPNSSNVSLQMFPYCLSSQLRG